MTGTSQVVELARCRPGLELAGLLAGIDPMVLTGKDAVAYAVAVQRQHNASCAARVAALLEVGLRARRSGDGVERMAELDRYSADEVRAGLALSLTASQRELSFAWAVCRRIPEVHSAMASGHLDEQRARAIVRWTEQLTDVQARSIAREVIPRCSALNPEPLVCGALIAEIAKLAIALDPEWAERMFKDGIRRRRIRGWRNPDGTATLAGQQLDPAEVAAACGRVNALAKTAKRTGDPRPIEQLRPDLYVRLLDGTYEGLMDAENPSSTTPGVSDGLCKGVTGEPGVTEVAVGRKDHSHDHDHCYEERLG